MRLNKGSSLRLALAVMIFASLACTLSFDSGGTTGGAVSVVINSPAEGSEVPVGVPVNIQATAFADAGVQRVELWLNTGVIGLVSPPSGTPQNFIANLSFTPATEGGAILAVVAYDVNNNSSTPATLTLQVVGAGATPTNTTAPEAPTNTSAPTSVPPSQTPIIIVITNTSPPPAPTKTKTPTPTATSGLIIVIPPGLFLPYTEQVYQQVNVPANDIAQATVACPAGSVVTGGGFATNTGVIVYTQSMQGNGWQAYGRNTTGSGKLLNAYAVCLHNTSGTTSQVLNQVTVSASTYGQAVATCPGGSVVTGGGWASSANNLDVYNSSKSGNGWQVYATNLTGSGQLLNAYAICLSGDAAHSDQSGSQNSINGGANGSTTGTCASGLATGGGFAKNTGIAIYNTSQNSSTTWTTYGNNTTGGSLLLNGYVICLVFD